jgi:hypothetical protein
VSRFGRQSIHTIRVTILRLDANVHRQVSSDYSSRQAFTGNQTVRQRLSTQSFEVQQQFDLDVLARFGVA